MTSSFRRIAVAHVFVAMISLLAAGCDGLFDDPDELTDWDLSEQHQACEDRTDCDDEEVCQGGLCTSISCDEKCTGDETCYRGTCAAACQQEADCDDTERCHDGKCVRLDCRDVVCDDSEGCYYGACRPHCDDSDDCTEYELPFDDPICHRGLCAGVPCVDSDTLPDGSPCPDEFFATLGVTDIDQTSATFEAALFELPEPAPIDHGFCWANEPEPTHDDSCHSLGGVDEAGPFELRSQGLSPGQTYYVRAFVGFGTDTDTEIEYADDAEPVTFTTSAPAATDLEADRGVDPDAVEIRWTPPQGVDQMEGLVGYRLLRDGEEIAELDSDAASWTDEDADPAGAPYASEVNATRGEHPDRIVVSWDAPSTPDGPSHTYRLVNLYEHEGGDRPSDHSNPAVGYRAGYPVDGYTLQVGDTDVDMEEATEFVHDADGDELPPPHPPTVEPGELTASSGDFSQYVLLEIDGMETHDGESVEYTVVAYNEAGAGDPSEPVEGFRGIGSVEFEWQRSANGQDFSAIGTTTDDAFFDTGAPESGASRTYRAVVHAGDSLSEQTTTDTGFRAAAPGVTTTAVEDVSDDSARVYGELLQVGAPSPDAHGVCVGTSLNPKVGEANCHDLGATDSADSFDAVVQDLSAGTRYYARAFAETDVHTSYGENLQFTTELPPPENLVASDGNYTEHVELNWTHPLSGEPGVAFAIVRNGEWIDTTEDTSYSDGGAEGGQLGEALSVEATEGESATTVVVSWSDVDTIPDGPTVTYAVVAVTDDAESSMSNWAEGYRSGYTVESYELRVDDGNWVDVGDDTEYVDGDADDASIDGADEAFSATSHPDYVQLDVDDITVQPGDVSQYDVRVRYGDDPDAVSKYVSATGHTGLDELQYQWQRLESSMSGSEFEELTTTSASTYQDDGIQPEEGTTYRAILDPDELEVTTNEDWAARTRFVYVAGRTGEVCSVYGDGDRDWCEEIHDDPTSAIAVDPDGAIYTASDDHDACKLSPDGSVQWCFDELGDIVQTVAAGPEGNLFAGSTTGELCKADEDGQVWCFDHGDVVNEIAVDADGRVYTASADETACFISADGNYSDCYDHGDFLYAVAVGTDDTFYVGATDGEVCYVNAEDPANDAVCHTPHSDHVQGVAVDHQDYVYTGSRDGTVCKLDQTGSSEWCVDQHGDSWIIDVAVDPDGYVYTASADDTACKLAPDDGSEQWCFDDDTWHKNDVAVFPGAYGAFPDQWED